MSACENNDRQTAAPDATAKGDAERLTLRAGPRLVSRINRRVLLALSATTLALVIGAVVFALDPPRLFEKDEKSMELYPADTPPKPEGLENLLRRPVQGGLIGQAGSEAWPTVARRSGRGRAGRGA